MKRNHAKTSWNGPKQRRRASKCTGRSKSRENPFGVRKMEAVSGSFLAPHSLRKRLIAPRHFLCACKEHELIRAGCAPRKVVNG